ncbi:hypothetical protein PF049_03635 [Erythrobacteraceae bacterium WH01K]|nr:hypothetical protein PF049_03635 [Erythrobacteraceae bacterium WH01K]
MADDVCEDANHDRSGDRIDEDNSPEQNSNQAGALSGIGALVFGAVAALLLALFLPELVRSLQDEAVTIPQIVIAALGLTYSAFLIVLVGTAHGRKMAVSSFERLNRAVAAAVSTLVGVNLNAELSSRPKDTEEIREALEYLRSRSASQSVNLSRGAEEEIIQLVRESFKDQLRPQMDLAFGHIIKERARDFSRNDAIDVLLDATEQLKRASSTVTVRGFINLIIGIGFALAALYFLKESVEAFDPVQIARLSQSQAIYLIGIRVSLTIVITAIAYFFLSLYRRSLEDVKYYQNEVAFLSGRVAAIALVISAGDKESLAHAMPLLNSTDRNKADQKSVEARSVDVTFFEKVLEKIPSLKAE